MPTIGMPVVCAVPIKCTTNIWAKKMVSALGCSLFPSSILKNKPVVHFETTIYWKLRHAELVSASHHIFSSNTYKM